MKLFNRKGINTDVLVIILLIFGLAIFVIIFLLLSSQGKEFLGNLSNLGWLY